MATIKIARKSPKKKSIKVKAVRAKSPRYGIGEWFGHDVHTLTPDERERFARLSFAQTSGVRKMSFEEATVFWKQAFNRDLHADDLVAPSCPFLSSLAPNSPCTKAGGVCSMRRYDHQIDGSGCATTDAPPPTVCPFRFLEDGALLRWVGEKMLLTRNPVVIKETPFLRKIATIGGIGLATEEDLPDDEIEDVDDGKKAGRIDWLLVDPKTLDDAVPDWCAVETQGVYFSGDQWKVEYAAYARDGSKVLYPIGRRAPDYRSNGPKRLAPQLSVKVPVLRAWGNKVAVIVDRYFFKQMAPIQPAFPGKQKESTQLAQSEVVWFIADYDVEMKLVPGEVIYSDLAKSIDALNATRPIDRNLFQKSLTLLLQNKVREGSKVFTLNAESV